MTKSLWIVLVGLIFSTSAVHAGADSAPVIPAAQKFSDTCEGTPNRGFSALDIDADGVLNTYRDYVLLQLLMKGDLNKIPAGATKSNREIFPSPSGIRREFEIYYRNTLLNIGLDVDGDGKVDPETDGKIIYLYMLNTEFGGQGVPDSALEKAAAPGHKVKFAQLAKLKNRKIVCRSGKAQFFDSGLDLQPAAHHSVGWGGEGLVWVYSRSLKAWLFLDRAGDLYQWEPKSNPAQGKLITRGLDAFYSAHPEILVNLAR